MTSPSTWERAKTVQNYNFLLTSDTYFYIKKERSPTFDSDSTPFCHNLCTKLRFMFPYFTYTFLPFLM